MNQLDGFDHSPSVVTSHVPIAPAQADRFTVMLGSRLSFRHGMWRARAFKQLAVVHLGHDAMTLLSSTNHWFEADTNSTLTIAWDRIYNVAALGRLVQFEVTTDNGQPQAFVLQAKSAAQARSLADALPVCATDSFAIEQNKLRLFSSRSGLLKPYGWATWLLIAINILVYLSMGLHGAGWFKPNPVVAIHYGSNFGPYTFNGEEWRLFSSGFIHFGFWHIALNMVFLAYVGTMVERLFGSRRFLLIYFFSTLSASLMSSIWHFQNNSAGASGPIFGVLGALLAYALREGKSLPKAVYVRHLTFALVFIANNLVSGFGHTQIDNGAHVGGLVGGMLLGWLLAKPLDAVPTKTAGVQMGAVVDSMSAVLALGLLAGCAVYFAPSFERQQELRYLATVAEAHPALMRALEHAKLYSKIGKTPAEQAAFADHVKNLLLPEWDALYKQIEAAPVATASPLYLYRDTLLHYYDDMRQMLATLEEATEQDGHNNEQQVLQKLQTLAFDTQQQTLWMQQNRARYQAQSAALLKGAR